MTGHPGREEPDRPLEGLGAFAWKLSLASVVAIAGVAVVLLIRGDGTEPPPASAASANAVVTPTTRSVVVPELPDQPAESAIGRDIDRRHAAGELSDAQRRFAPCRGGDLRRLAWIDPQQRVRKLVHWRATGLVLEQWFDEEGRLREALVRGTAGARAWSRRVTIDERGVEVVVDSPPAAVPDEPPPPLVRGDPSGAFFGGAGCNG